MNPKIVGASPRQPEKRCTSAIHLTEMTKCQSQRNAATMMPGSIQRQWTGTVAGKYHPLQLTAEARSPYSRGTGAGIMLNTAGQASAARTSTAFAVPPNRLRKNNEFSAWWY